MSEYWNRKIHPVVVGLVIGNTVEKGPLRLNLTEDDDGVTLDMILAIGVDVGQTAARLPGRGETVKVTLHLADKTALQVTGRVDLVGQSWGMVPVGEARVRIRGRQVVVMPSLVVAGTGNDVAPRAGSL